MKPSRPHSRALSVPDKAARVLSIILFFLLLIVLRLWHLTEVQYDDRLEEAVKPRRRVVMEPAKRGTIRDRFNIPLAINRVQYQAGVVYGEVRQIPAIKWVTDEKGKRTKIYRRKNYLRELSELLGAELDMDPNRIEDLIHSKASFYFQMPFVLKEEITEEQYYRLNMLAKDWPGLHVQRVPARFYPKGKVAADVIGYIGAINREEYDRIIEELSFLRDYVRQLEEGDSIPLPQGYASIEQLYHRLKDLEDQSYTANDLVGKAGVEQQLEPMLRGFHGKKAYYSDARGNFLRELPGSRPPLSGQRVLLSLSAELQEYAEELLAANEKLRKTRVKGKGKVNDPWTKGGAIVAMDPNTGEVMALASYPRFDPNDFVGKDRSEVDHWFETDHYIGDLWDQRKPMEREIFSLELGEMTTEQQWLTWDRYLQMILPDDNPVREALNQIGTVQNAIQLQRQIDRILQLSGQDDLLRLLNLLYDNDEHFRYGSPAPAHVRAAILEQLEAESATFLKARNALDKWFEILPHNYDKVLLVDLCRLAVDAHNFDDQLLSVVGRMSLNEYRRLSSAFIAIRSVVKEVVRQEFRVSYFFPWREQYGKDFLKKKRYEEEERHTWARPYIDYYDKKEKELFEGFWERYQGRFLTLFIAGREVVQSLSPYDQSLLTWQEELSLGAHQAVPWRKAYETLKESTEKLSPQQMYALLQTFRGYNDLNRPVYGRYRHLKKQGKTQLLKHLAAAFYPVYGYGNARSYAYRQATTQGSLFKLVTAYAAMMQRYRQIDDAYLTATDLNPLTLVDSNFKRKGKQYVGEFSNGKPIPMIYKGGRLMKSVSHHIGKIDLLDAIESSSNPYFSLLAAEVLEDPLDLARIARHFSFGKKTGIELPLELAGRVPDDLDFNKTGLYAMANGQHSLVVTPLQTAVMLSAIANGGYILQPKIINLLAGHVPNRGEELNQWRVDYPFRETLRMIGIDFPLFVDGLQRHQQQIEHWPTQVSGKVDMPTLVRNMLLEGMRRVTSHITKRGLGGLTQLYADAPEAVSALLDLKKELVGKTSTAESLENINLDLYRGTQKFNHVWYGGIAFDKELDPHGFLSHSQEGKPELVVVVFFKYGAFGKEAAPIAAQIVNKWREIKASHQQQEES